MIYDIEGILKNKSNYDEVERILGILEADVITDKVEKEQNDAISRLFELGEDKIIDLLGLKKPV